MHSTTLGCSFRPPSWHVEHFARFRVRQSNNTRYPLIEVVVSQLRHAGSCRSLTLRLGPVFIDIVGVSDSGGGFQGAKKKIGGALVVLHLQQIRPWPRERERERETLCVCPLCSSSSSSSSKEEHGQEDVAKSPQRARG